MEEGRRFNVVQRACTMVYCNLDLSTAPIKGNAGRFQELSSGVYVQEKCIKLYCETEFWAKERDFKAIDVLEICYLSIDVGGPDGLLKAPASARSPVEGWKLAPQPFPQLETKLETSLSL